MRTSALNIALHVFSVKDPGVTAYLSLEENHKGFFSQVSRLLHDAYSQILCRVSCQQALRARWDTRVHLTVFQAYWRVITRPVDRVSSFLNLAGCVKSGQEVFENSRVGSGLLGVGSGSGRVKSGRVGSSRVGSGRVGSDRVGSGRVRRF